MKRWLLAVAAMSLVVAACSAGSGASGVATLEDTAEDRAAIQGQADDGTASEVTQEEALLEFAACMRENGVEDFEDPSLSADGGVGFTFRGGVDGADIDREVIRAAMETCREELDGVALGPGGGDFDLTEIQDQLIAFAACMRDQGVDMPDPEIGGEPGAGGPFGDVDFEDPDVQAAMEICQAEFGGEVRVPGAGRGPGGGDGATGRAAPGGES